MAEEPRFRTVNEGTASILKLIGSSFIVTFLIFVALPYSDQNATLLWTTDIGKISQRIIYGLAFFGGLFVFIALLLDFRKNKVVSS